MANYVQDPNDSKKQVPGAPPDNYYDRTTREVEISELLTWRHFTCS